MQRVRPSQRNWDFAAVTGGATVFDDGGALAPLIVDDCSGGRACSLRALDNLSAVCGCDPAVLGQDWD